ncbi:MAG: hypothetical protein A2Y56_05965 [Candidatus Aminicenantes bacterium RBG_13_63_10]|nr:MAG: hypothetical protein A2Y56_05965 [Candidatus Aminicenantes bacterium RBG_13_63_10]
MRKIVALVCLTLGGAALTVSAANAADQVWINDIRANPVRHWNTTVTVTGLVQEVRSDPAGTTRGFYIIQDESIVTGAINVGELPYNQLYVRTNNLPPIGKTFKVTGTVIQDPTRADLPILKEDSRSTVGLSSTLRVILIAAIVMFIGLIIALVLLLARPKARAAAAAGRTTRLAAEPEAAKTQVYVDLGAGLVVEKGPDKGREFPLTKMSNAIGRAGARKNEVELADDTVSKEQATIHFDSSKKTFTIVNESATNPTKVNGAVISGQAALENNASVEMGKTLLRFRKS